MKQAEFGGGGYRVPAKSVANPRVPNVGDNRQIVSRREMLPEWEGWGLQKQAIPTELREPDFIAVGNVDRKDEQGRPVRVIDPLVWIHKSKSFLKSMKIVRGKGK